MVELEVAGAAPFMYHEIVKERLEDLDSRVQEMRNVGKLDSTALERIHEFFKIKGIYHSNAIEGNRLTIGETELVVKQGITIAGKTLADQAEAKNLGHALDFMKEIAVSKEKPIIVHDIRQIHALILRDIQDEHAGKYRKSEVKISGSDYKPTRSDLVPLSMDELGSYIKVVTSSETDVEDLPIVIAAAAHAWLAQIHPFVDGNGRTARILMNLILMRRGYTICIITRDDRLRYYEALELSQTGDLTPLIELIYENVEESLEEWERAAEEQRRGQEWLVAITDRIERPELSRLRNEYEVWLNAMELLKSYFRQIVDNLKETISVSSVRLNFRDFGILDFEKYRHLRNEESAKKTWCFGIDLKMGSRRARYLFFFGYADHRLRSRARVILFVAKDEDSSYVRLEDITKSNKPDIYQVGFDMQAQSYVALTIGGVRETKIEALARKFFDQVIERDFRS